METSKYRNIEAICESSVEIEDYSILVKNELVMLIKALGLPQHCGTLSANRCLYKLLHPESALTSGHLHSIRTRHHQHVIKMTRFNAVYLRLCDSYKHGSNTNGERHLSSKAAVPLKTKQVDTTYALSVRSLLRFYLLGRGEDSPKHCSFPKNF